MRKRNQPPLILKRFFEWFCNEEYFEELQGDLEEKFHQRTQSIGIRRARLAYGKEVMKLFRPSVFKRIKFKYSNNTAMFRNYTLVAYRNLLRNKLFSVINIIGLAISMAVGLIAIAFVSEIYSYDNFHENSNRIYRVTTDLHRNNGETSEYATASVFAGRRLATDFAGFEAVAPITKGLSSNIKKGESTISVQGIYADNSFFKVLTFPFLSGNPETALNEPNSIVLTESTARKLFSKTDVVGETLQWRKDSPVKVTGVLKDPPKNSHIRFDAIGSLETLDDRNSSSVNDFGVIWSSYVYVLLPEQHDMEQIQANLNQLAKEENPKLKYWQFSMGLEKLSDIFPGNGRYNQFGTVMPKKKVRSMIILALIVLFSACFNYTNLSLARSIKRAKEIGVRKVVGASKTHLFMQFILEAVLVSILALVLSYWLFQLIKPEFLSLDFYIQRTTTLDLSASVYLYFLLFAVVIGFLAGLFPSLLMTKFRPVNILKGAVSVKTSKGLSARQVLVCIQFALSMGFATLVTMAYKQYQYALNFDLGFSTENVLNVDMQSNDPEILKTEFLAIPEVSGVSSSSILPSTGSSMSNYVKHKDPQDSVNAFTLDIGPDYLNNMGHQLVAGPGFEEADLSNKAIVNQMFLKKIGINTPEEAIGEQVSFFQKNWTIVGVIKDFHHGTINDPIEAFVFTTGRQDHYHINVKLSTNDIVGTMSKLDEAWQKVDPVKPFSAKFYDELIQDTYSDISASLKTFGLLSGIAICISILGLLGMAVYTAESRIKELAIRKVLGATITNLLMLLGKNFMIIFLLSASVAIPLAYYVYQKTIVSDAVYQISVGFWELANGALLIIVIAILTICSQTLRAARTNPAENLRNE